MKVGINTFDPGSAIDDVRVLYIEHAGCLYRVWAPNGERERHDHQEQAMSDADNVHRRSTEQGRELRDAVTKLRAQREAEIAATASAPLPDIDIEAMVQALPTAFLVTVIAVEHVRESVVDPGGILHARAVNLDAAEGKAADDELEARMARLLVAASVELNRRIPIPEGR